MELTWQDSNTIPEWWHDIHQSLHSAFSQFGLYLTAIEDSSAKNAFLHHDDALVLMATEFERASERLKQVLKLAQVRLNDARVAGLPLIPMEHYRAMATDVLSRSMEIKIKLAAQMKKINHEIQQCKTPRKVKQIYNILTPSYIDLHL